MKNTLKPITVAQLWKAFTESCESLQERDELMEELLAKSKITKAEFEKATGVKIK
ncbi:hypothetical protein NDK43_06750 [Neobacillus pocheonensis]|uniref:XkdX family protein n=1 Tax=Neobacillus pocheonensis TaxID=363869 RepID=A0ABT0W811_9BACI|nr:hypothetical protein [Neobacillus pocheonensis]